MLSSTVNEGVDLDTFSRKGKKSRKKEERKKRKKKKERHLCLTLSTWLNKADCLKENKEKRKKKERKGKRRKSDICV